MEANAPGTVATAQARPSRGLNHDNVSPRQRYVAIRLAQGKTCREIADETGISVKTIDTHRHAARLAIRLGWIDADGVEVAS